MRHLKQATMAERLALMRLGALVLLGVAIGSGPAVWAQTPADLFWEGDAASVLVGGVDVPGQVSGRPEVERPTSLAAACSPVVRLNAYSQMPIIFERGDETVARWTSDVAEAEYLAPVGEPGRWTIGLRHRRTRTVVEEHEADLDYRLLLEGQERGLAVAYAGREGWVVGVGVSDSDLRGGASGGSIGEALRLPADTRRWPKLAAEGFEWTVGLSRVRDRVQWGVQYTGARPDVEVWLSRGQQRYESVLFVEERRVEAYAVHQRGPEKWFVVAADWRMRGQGTVLMGLSARGDLGGYAHDCSVGIGWERAEPEGRSEIMLDWRDTSIGTRDQGHFGPLPGLLSPVYGFEGEAQVSTISLRCGREWALTEQWRVFSGFSAHHANAEGRYRLRKSAGIGRDPETISAREVKGGILEAVGLSLGIGYRSAHWNCVAAASGAYVKTNRALRGVGAPGEAERARFKPRPLLALSVEYRF